MSELDPAAALYVQLGRLVRVLRQESEGTPVGPGGVSAMVTLSRNEGGLRLGELAEIEGVSPPSMTRIVKALCELDLVERAPDSLDGRAQRVTLTATGRAMIISGQDSRLTALRRRMETLSAEDRGRIEAALPAIDALLDASV